MLQLALTKRFASGDHCQPKPRTDDGDLRWEAARD
jgi:hypothetical protein